MCVMNKPALQNGLQVNLELAGTIGRFFIAYWLKMGVFGK